VRAGEGQLESKGDHAICSKCKSIHDVWSRRANNKQYWALDLQVRNSVDRTKIQHHFAKCDKDFLNTRLNHVPTASMSNISLDSGLNGDDKQTHDFYLHAMGVNVAHHPTGRAAQMLTRVIRHVVQVTGDRNVRLSQAAQYAQRHGITVPPNERMSSNLSITDRPDPVIMGAATAAYLRKFGVLP
jgi:hypothetical protein